MRRVVIFTCLLTWASIASAQPTSVIQPFQVDKGVKSFPISTDSFPQQIVEVEGQIKRTVNNRLDHPVPGPGERNSLAFGLMSPLATPGIPGKSFPAINATGWSPPDPDLAVGPAHCVNTVNVAVAFFTRTGTKLFEQDLGQTGFFQGVATAGFVFDPKCFYDPTSQRYFIVALEQDDAAQISGLLIAVSDDNNPMGNWNRYRIEAKQTVGTESFWLDYPGFGFSKDAIMITGNMFGFVGGFNGIQFLVVRKAELLTGAPATITKFTQGGGSAQVMRTPNDLNTPILYAMSFENTSTARLYAVQNPATIPTLVATNCTIPTFDGPNKGGTSVNNHELDSLDGRVFNLHYRGGHLYAAHGIQAGPNDNRCVGRWYDINLRSWPAGANQPIFAQGGNVGTPGQDFILPAICPNGNGEIAMVATRCSPSIVADFVIAGRRGNDPLGTMRAPVKLAGSIGSQYGGTSNRWGDYFGLQVDPLDDKTFWGVGMVANASGGWLTVINSFRLTVPFNDTPDSVAKFEGAATTGTVASIVNSDNAYFTVNSTSIIRTGQVASAVSEFTLPGPTQELSAIVESRAIAGVTGSLFFFDWTTSQYVFMGANPMTGTDATKTYAAGANYTKFINAQNKVRVLVRAIYPAKVGTSPLAFQLKIDKVSLTGAN